jgi:hypothetical protein
MLRENKQMKLSQYRSLYDVSECQRISEPRDHEYLSHFDHQKVSHLKIS